MQSYTIVSMVSLMLDLLYLLWYYTISTAVKIFIFSRLFLFGVNGISAQKEIFSFLVYYSLLSFTLSFSAFLTYFHLFKCQGTVELKT